MCPACHGCAGKQVAIHESRMEPVGRLEKWDQRFLALCEHVAGWSKDPGTKVGSIIADGNRVISVGYNGYPSKLNDVYLDEREYKLSRTVHAELNAIFNARVPVQGMTLYTSFPCCDRCAVHVIQAGIERVVWREATVNAWANSQEAARKYFQEAGVQVFEIE